MSADRQDIPRRQVRFMPRISTRLSGRTRRTHVTRHIRQLSDTRRSSERGVGVASHAGTDPAFDASHDTPTPERAHRKSIRTEPNKPPHVDAPKQKLLVELARLAADSRAANEAHMCSRSARATSIMKVPYRRAQASIVIYRASTSRIMRYRHEGDAESALLVDAQCSRELGEPASTGLEEQ